MRSLAFLSVLAWGISAAEAADVVAVCPEAFRPSLAVWIAHRTGQGHQVAVVSNRGTPLEIRKRIQQAAGEVKFVVLIGDADPTMQYDPVIRARSVPTWHVPAKVNIAWGSEPHIATDDLYGDLDEDGLPDAAVGRLPVNTAGQLADLVQRILAYEGDRHHGMWRRRVNFVAGLGGFGGVADYLIEQGATALITGDIPAGYATTMTYASWRSPFCPDPRRLGQTTLKRINEGCLFWVYMGHGWYRGLDRMRVPGKEFPILDADDVARLACRQGAPIAVLLACYTGAFDATDDCLAEEMLVQPNGPVAVLAGSRVTMPYAMASLGRELLGQYLQQRRSTLGQVVLHAKRQLVLGRRTDALSRVLETSAWLLSGPGSDLAAERREHVALFNLLGDPTMTLPQPKPVAMSVAARAAADSWLDVAGSCPIDGTATVELVVRRDRMTIERPSRTRYDGSSAALEAYQAVYLAANNHQLAIQETAVVDHHFQTRLRVPSHARGDCHVRVFVDGEKGFALGAADVTILPETRPEAAEGVRAAARPPSPPSDAIRRR